jgi:uncharacterized membrane protein (DUF485 family)
MLTKTTKEMLGSREFQQMVSKRWTISIVLTAALFVIYYGYIVLIAVDKTFMSKKIGEVTTLGIPLGVAVIILSWVLTAIYVSWGNTVYDTEVRRLRDLLKR